MSTAVPEVIPPRLAILSSLFDKKSYDHAAFLFHAVSETFPEVRALNRELAEGLRNLICLQS